MTYALLGHSLHETADRAKKYFAREYGAAKFVCESEVEDDLPLRPTWQANMQGGYRLCIEVRESPFSHSLYQFVTLCAGRHLPIRLWVAMPAGPAGDTFNKELREAKAVGVGVVQLADNDGAHEFHRPAPLSLFGLRRTDIHAVPKKHRESIKKAEDAFLDGTPDQGYQLICQELESVTRAFAEHSYGKNDWWKNKNSLNLKARFFSKDSWANMLEKLDGEIVQAKVEGKCPTFKKALIAGARQYIDSRNSVSHKPKTLKQLQTRDAKLRTLYEATRDLVLEWYEVARALKLNI